MNSKDKIIAIIFTILVSIICLIPIYDFKIYAKETPKSLFKVYLNGKSIGVIESKEKLEKYINNEQKDLKEKYNVQILELKNIKEKYQEMLTDVINESKRQL